MTENQELSVLKGQVSRLVNQVSELAISTPDENIEAMTLKSKLKEISKEITAKKEGITKPLNEALKSARALFAPLEEQYETADKLIGRKLLDYKSKVDAEARVEEAKIAAKLEADRIKLEAEVEAGKITQEKADAKMETRLEKAEDKMDNVARVDKHTQTAHGRVQFKIVKKVVVTDETKIPKAYWSLDMVAVRRDALAGILTEGVKIVEEETV